MRRRADRLAFIVVAALLAALPGAHTLKDARQVGPSGVAGAPTAPSKAAARDRDVTTDDGVAVSVGVAQAVYELYQEPVDLLAGDAVIPPPPETFDAPPDPPAPPPKPLRRATFEGVEPEGGVWAVAIGINDYPGGRSDLRSAVNDGRDMVQALAGFGVPGDHILQIEDRQASADVILASLDWLVAHSSGEATAVFFYAGHVRKIGSGTEAIVAADGRLVTDDQVAQRLDALAARNVWVVMATCYGGGFSEVLRPGRVLTAAASANSLAYENESFGRSYLVQYMVRKAMIERHAPNSVQSAYEWAWHAIARDYPHRTPVQFDHAGSPVTLGSSGSMSPQPSQPPPSQPAPPPSGGGGGGNESRPPPEDEDDDSCGGVKLGTLVDCSPD